MPVSRWHQDIEVAQLIAHFDEPDKYEKWDRLTAAEIAVILKELDRCRKDFVYAARNYFWISNKKLGDQLFSLWPSQEIILQKILEMKAKGMPQKLIIIKARQLGCSTLIEALICWRTVFFTNVNALVVSKDINHAAYALWPIMQFIYDRLPWWLQPMCSSRKAEEGMTFENPRYEERRRNPGLNSRIYVKGATSAGVGQGIRLSAVHVSEFSDFEDNIAKEIIDEDMVNALVEDSNTFAILESTAKGANRYAHRLWKKCVQLERNAEWFPVFLPWFFEDSRVRPVTVDFRLDQQESLMRERIVNEWVRCDNPPCKQYHLRYINHTEDRSETVCVTCGVGILSPFLLTNEQLNWIQHRRKNAERDEDSIRKLAQEMASSGEEAFQITGYQVFGPKAQEFAIQSIREPIAIGDLDSSGRLHGPNTRAAKVAGNHGDFFPCFQEDCTVDHSFDNNPLQIWEMPIPEAEYCIGADVSGGLGGKSDYSAGVCIRCNNSASSPSYQVATWRSNDTDPILYASKLHHLGMMFNQALVSVEVNKYDMCLGALRFNLSYPNLYRWKYIDSVNALSNKYGWETNYKSKNRLWQTFKVFLNQQIFVPKSRNLAEEMKNFIKETMDDLDTGADREEHDDELIACMIALFCSVEGTYSEALGMAVPRSELTMQNAPYHITCLNCRNTWPDNRPPASLLNAEFEAPTTDAGIVSQSAGSRCALCGSRRVEVVRNTSLSPFQSDESALIREVTGEYWTPEKEFDNAALPYELL